MTDLEDDEPYLTFSEDWRYAFIERRLGTKTPLGALLRLDGRLGEVERPVVPTIRRWTPRRARVLGVEIWDEEAGVELAGLAPGARLLWRIDVAHALALELSGDFDGRRLIRELTALRDAGQLADAELAYARQLLGGVEEAEAERRARQRLRALSAPRSPLRDGTGAWLGRLLGIVTEALGERPERQDEAMSRALRGLQHRLVSYEERQVQALRAELELLELG